MCGIACIINNSGIYAPDVLHKFTDSVSHRGPDGRGLAFFNSNGVKTADSTGFRIGLGHRRLSIIDLSHGGDQPMSIDGGNYEIVFNGEIYNYIEIRAELEKEGIVFKSQSDTEVLLAAYSRWGAGSLAKFNGMWAFVIYDRRKNIIFISRDRIGVKPLYWWRRGGNLAMASEIKQFFTLPDFHKEVNPDTLLSYLVSGYENPPETFFKDVFAFPPGHFAEINPDLPEFRPSRYWHPEKIQIQNYAEDEIVPQIREKFSDSVKLRLRSDVPVGGCLSGGLDSSSIFIEMKKQVPDITFNAFSSCFEDSSIDEQPFMRHVVNSTHSRHIRTFPSSAELAEDFDRFMFHHDEPVASVSMYAQFRVMKSARENNVPVLLDGQGGDELFSGYWPSYMLLLNHFRRTGGTFKIFAEMAKSVFPGGNQLILGEIWRNFREFRRRSERILPFGIRKEYGVAIEGLNTLSWHKEAVNLVPSEYRKAEIFRIHLPRLLKWEDRNSMAFSIESRVPFLDVNIVELLLSVPPEMNMRSGWTKYLFRKAMDGKLPSKICWRKDKKGFETPQEKWMKNGEFHDLLLNWTQERVHPISEYINNDFREICRNISDRSLAPIPLFRLFCADRWMKSF